MRKKILALGVTMCFMFFIVPVEEVFAIELHRTVVSNDTTSNVFLLAHVVAKGTGSCASFYGTFVLGVGYCVAMLVTLEDDGQIEITSLLDPSNTTTLEGSHRIYIVGFAGLRWNIPKINVNGLAFFAACS
jgi:hypothetical protein